MQILIVDDRMENRYLLEILLKSEGHDTVSAVNGKKALECLASGPFDLIITDILMPVMDGFQLCRYCKADQTLCHIPFVFYTATYVDEKDEAFAYEIGADGFLRKGMEPSAFLASIQAVIKNTQKGRLSPKPPVDKPEEETYKHYSERLIRKLEKKMQDLEQKEERLNMALEASRDGLWDWNIQTGEVYFSPRYYTMLGYEPNELPQTYDTWAGLLHPDDREAAEKSILDHIEKEFSPFEQEFRMKTRSGKWKWILGRGKVFSVDEKGRPVRIVGTHTDISRLKAVIRQARETRERYRNIIEVSPVGIAVHAGGKVVFSNRAGADILGALSPDDLTGKPIHEIIHPDNLDAAKARIQRMMAGEPGLYPVEDRYVRLDGTPIDVMVMATAISFQGAPAVQVVVQDITEKKRTEKELQQAETRLRQVQKLEAIGSLAGGIAHDFNNILSAIIGYAQLAIDRLPKDSPVQADLEQVYKGGERAKALVMQILAFSRQQEQSEIPIQIGPIVKEAVKFLQSTLPSSIDIQQQIAPDAGMVLADPTRIHQVLMNLCTNAAHAMDRAGGTLTVTLAGIILDPESAAALPDLLPGKYLKLTVADTGHGIAPQTLPRIFDPYFTTKRRSQGTGLGLATVHGIIKSCGGGITVSSTPGQGTTFHLYFPVMGDPVKPVPEKPAPATAAGNHACILFVDDEPPIANLGKRLLEHLGYQAEARTDPLEALALIKADPGRFDLVITDLTMPGMSGDNLASELTKIRPNLPVIMCSGFSRDMTKAAAEAAGIKAFVLKPILKDNLAAVIRQVLAGDEA
ncbi:hybrid sensor histidine kinase/response regulator [Desulfotignum phosphitoxidans]|uniref:histidine kinase n=1 Tax=Desulfotignum phosphitoxidans DSM 13687 TaxID=1286635 RepID=S0FXZ2_9BACT|nr:response regulator [Desulfotignum phosphitoxidans]EMS79938.1 two component histidine kinase [Desulfotignum phosphitoxidans DSM 13687]